MHISPRFLLAFFIVGCLLTIPTKAMDEPLVPSPTASATVQAAAVKESERETSSANSVGDSADDKTNAAASAANTVFDPPSLRETFKDVVFVGAQPRQIVRRDHIDIRGGALAVYFIDIDSLETMPGDSFSSTGGICFIQDEKAGKEGKLLASPGTIKEGSIIEVLSDGPAVLKGQLTLDCPLFVPSIITSGPGLSATTKGLMHSRTPLNTVYRNGQIIKKALQANFDDLIAQKETAQTLLRQRKEDRQRNPQNYPPLQSLCPKAVFSSTNLADPIVEQVDSLYSETPIVIVAPSMDQMKELEKEIKPFSGRGISLIIPSCRATGIFCESTFSVVTSFTIESYGAFVIEGEINLPEHHLFFDAKGGFKLPVNSRVSGKYLRVLIP